VGRRRSVYFGLASAYSREKEAQAALGRAGASRLDPTQAVITADYSLISQDGFRFRPRRLVEFATDVHVPQGLRLRRQAAASWACAVMIPLGSVNRQGWLHDAAPSAGRGCSLLFRGWRQREPTTVAQRRSAGVHPASLLGR
jgi:hypothetical protein